MERWPGSTGVHYPCRGPLSIISDIDDTIKISVVRDRKELLRNVFVRSYKEAPGMATLYQSLGQQGATFHYVSGSPWHLYAPLKDFMQRARFPIGTFELKYFRPGDSSFFAFLDADPFEYKVQAISRIMERDFVLIGDSGEKDPEIYERVVGQFPGRVRSVWIRNVTEETAADDRFQGLRAMNVDFRLFEYPQELR